MTMTLDEAIIHCTEVAACEGRPINKACGEEHKQLAEWLKELKERRINYEKMHDKHIKEQK